MSGWGTTFQAQIIANRLVLVNALYVLCSGELNSQLGKSYNDSWVVNANQVGWVSLVVLMKENVT